MRTSRELDYPFHIREPVCGRQVTEMRMPDRIVQKKRIYAVVQESSSHFPFQQRMQQELTRMAEQEELRAVFVRAEG